MDSVEQRINDLRTLLNHHNHQYYVLNSPEISDRDYDMLLKELEALEEANPQFQDELSPTRRVGSDLGGTGFKQVVHVRPMLSLANTYSVEEVDQWVKRCDDTLGHKELTLIGEMKFDGTSISITYINGRMVRAVTRGDGEKGDDVTENIKTIKSIPTVLQPGLGWPEEFEVRGEVLLPWDEFDRLNKIREYNEEPLFANPRNAAAGTLKMKSPADVAKRRLDAVFYYLLGDNLPYNNHYDNMLAVGRWGFKISDAMTPLHSIKEVDDFISQWDEGRKSLPIATDGLVFKVNSLNEQTTLGRTAKSPRWAIAYKFAAEKALTRLRFVSFEVGRMGIVTPVANLEPVLLSGTIVKRASLHNEDIMNTLGIHEHDMLQVEKGGEIIPKITDVDTSDRIPGSAKVVFPSHCPDCGAALVRVEGEADWRCPNKYGCKPQIIGRLEHFVGRHMMDIDGVGEETAALLYNTGLVRTSADFYDLTIDRLRQVGVGDKTSTRIIAGVEASLSVPFERVVYALSIPYVGETVAKKLARGVGNIDNLMSYSREQLMAIDEIGPRIADAIIEFRQWPDNAENIKRLTNAGVQMQVAQSSVPVSDKLQGKIIVISGVFTKHSREELKDIIELNGGKNAGSISKKTSFILAGDNMGPAKLEKAQSLGIPIISEDDFLEMLK